jgi:AraC-like DNA-binding protein
MGELSRLRSSTTLPDEADELLLAANGHFAFASDPGAGFSMEVEQEGDADLIVADYFIGGEWQSSGESEMFCVATVVGGDYRWEIDDERGDGSLAPFLLRPGHDFRCEAGELRIVNFSLSPERLREVATTSYGEQGGRVVFDSPRPRSEGHAALVFDVATSAGEYMRSGTFRHPLVRAALFHTMAVATLEGFHLATEFPERGWSVAGRQAVYRRAVRFIEDNASLPITIGDVAQAAGATLAELDTAFRAHVDMGAGGYLRTVRLAAARSELMASAAPCDIAELAARWGFADVTRFTRRYVRAYGETPAATLAGERSQNTL